MWMLEKNIYLLYKDVDVRKNIYLLYKDGDVRKKYLSTVQRCGC